jgi:hypothetical protein
MEKMVALWATKSGKNHIISYHIRIEKSYHIIPYRKIISYHITYHIISKNHIITFPYNWSLRFRMGRVSGDAICMYIEKSYHTISYRKIISYISYHISYRKIILPYHTISYHIIPYHTIPYHIIVTISYLYRAKHIATIIGHIARLS